MPRNHNDDNYWTFTVSQITLMISFDSWVYVFQSLSSFFFQMRKLWFQLSNLPWVISFSCRAELKPTYGDFHSCTSTLCPALPCRVFVGVVVLHKTSAQDEGEREVDTESDTQRVVQWPEIPALKPDHLASNPFPSLTDCCCHYYVKYSAMSPSHKLLGHIHCATHILF